MTALDNRRTPGSRAANQYGVSQVKYGTPAQVKFAARLAAERDTTGLEVPADFATVNRRALSDWIDTLLARPERPGTPAAAEANRFGASEKQVAFIARLAGEKAWEDLANPSDAAVIRHALNNAATAISKREASSVIDWLMTLMRKAPQTPQGAVALDDAMYLKDGVVLKVYHTVHGANQQVAKRLRVEAIAEANEQGYELAAADKWEYLGKRGLAGLTAAHRMTLVQAKEFGAIYGVCCNCGATLTNELSIELGIGPVCRSKFA